jgi:tRNA-dihydrouridine synthase A
MARDWGYNEVNLNVGCPSDRVQNGRFGACLMAEPALVADCLGAMIDAVDIPVTVKHRIGIDDLDSYALLQRFVATVADSGCGTFIVHARKAFLQGLSPKENRDVPPLRYEVVYRLKEDFPELEIILNGGVKSLAEARDHLTRVDGVMIGREAYQNPFILADADREIFNGSAPAPTRVEVLDGIYRYVEDQLARGAQLGWIARHILCLFQGQPGARGFRRHISENAFKPGAGIEVLRQAASKIQPRVTDAA